MKFEIELTPAEMAALEELAIQQDLPKERVVIQALRIYQAIKLGTYVLIDNTGLRAMKKVE